MKAAVYDRPGAPDVLRYTDVPDPVCGPDDVLIKIEAISIEGGDLINRATAVPRQPAHIVGYSAAGTIVRVGTNVDHRQIGQRVVTMAMDGSHAELRAAPAHWTWLLPVGLDPAMAAALPVSFGTAYESLFTRAGLQPGETVFIQGGTGGVGVAAIQLAKQHGARVIATVSGEERTAHLRRLGLDEPIDRHQEDVAARVRQLTNGRGADIVLDLVGSTLGTSMIALRDEGRLVVAGNAGGSTVVDLWPAKEANQTIYGIFWGSALGKPETDTALESMLAGVASGALEVVIDRRFALSDVVQAHRHAETQIVGRVALIP